MQDSLPAGGLRLCRAGVEPAGSLREVSVSIHNILLSRAYPGAITVRHWRGVQAEADTPITPPLRGIEGDRRSRAAKRRLMRWGARDLAGLSPFVRTIGFSVRMLVCYSLSLLGLSMSRGEISLSGVRILLGGRYRRDHPAAAVTARKRCNGCTTASAPSPVGASPVNERITERSSAYSASRR